MELVGAARSIEVEVKKTSTLENRFQLATICFCRCRVDRGVGVSGWTIFSFMCFFELFGFFHFKKRFSSSSMSPKTTHVERDLTKSRKMNGAFHHHH